MPAGAVPTHPDHTAGARPSARTFRELPPSSSLAYYQFRDALASDIQKGLVGQTIKEIAARARACSGYDPADAAEWTERFVEDLKRHLDRKQGKR